MFSLPYWSEWRARGPPDPWPRSYVCNLFICQCLLIRGDRGAEHKPGFHKLFAPTTDYLNIDNLLCSTRHAYGRGPTDRIKHYGGHIDLGVLLVTPRPRADIRYVCVYVFVCLNFRAILFSITYNLNKSLVFPPAPTFQNVHDKWNVQWIFHHKSWKRSRLWGHVVPSRSGLRTCPGSRPASCSPARPQRKPRRSFGEMDCPAQRNVTEVCLYSSVRPQSGFDVVSDANVVYLFL